MHPAADTYDFDTVAPADLGMPPRFLDYRASQRQGFDWFFNDCTHQISAALKPPGCGKTLWGVSLARMQQAKMVYLVATKALEAQVMSDFGSIGMCNVHGRANYECPAYGNCDLGYDKGCSRSDTEACPYACAVSVAKDSELCVTNYAYWLHARRASRNALTTDCNSVDFLVCDEAHAIERQIDSFASVRLYARELGNAHAGTFGKSGIVDEQAPWRDWATVRVKALRDKEIRNDGLDEDDEDLLERLERVARMHAGYVWQFDERGHVAFTPISVAPWMKAVLSGVPRVLLMSASLSDFMLKMLMPDDVEYDYRRWPPVFPGQNAPVYHIPTVKLSWKSTEEDYASIIRAADQIIGARQDRKGIVHTVSYARARTAMRHSQFAANCVWNEDGGTLQDCLRRFRAAGPGTVLVTPSVEEGFDFPATDAEYQILLKFPFPNENERVIKERCARIAGYRLHHAAQKVVQIRGRAVRSATDRAELFILDNAVRQLCGNEGRAYLPPGFRIFTVTQVPPAPPRMQPTN